MLRGWAPPMTISGVHDWPVLGVHRGRRVVKGDLAIQFGPQALTSYGGLELLGRYLRRIDLGARLRQAFAGLRSDYGSHRLALVLLALFYVGARRLEWSAPRSS